jgi:hypothetical protein
VVVTSVVTSFPAFYIRCQAWTRRSTVFTFFVFCRASVRGVGAARWSGSGDVGVWRKWAFSCDTQVPIDRSLVVRAVMSVTEWHTRSLPVTRVRLIRQNACVGCACEEACIFLPPSSAALLDVTLISFECEDTMLLWRGVFSGAFCVNSMVSFHKSWFFVSVLSSMAMYCCARACQEDHLVVLLRVLARAGARVDVQWVLSRSALYAAAFNGCLKVFEELVRLGADVGVRDETGCSVLHAFGRDPDRVEAEQRAVLLLVNYRLPISLIASFIDMPPPLVQEPLRQFLCAVYPRVRAARKAIAEVLVAHRASPSSMFARLPPEIMAMVLVYLEFSQATADWD